MQESLRETFGGENFWQVLRKKMDKKVRERKLMKDREDIIEMENVEKGEEFKRKLEFYEDRVAEMNVKYKKEQ